MTLVNFYHETPTKRQITSDLSNHELVVFNHTRTGARKLSNDVDDEADFPVNMHNENTVQPWEADDYFVMVRSDFDYVEKRDELRRLAAAWIASGCPDQVKHI